MTVSQITPENGVHSSRPFQGPGPDRPEASMGRDPRPPHFRLLRAHGLICKLTGTSRYQVMKRGIEVMSTALRVRSVNLNLFKQTA
jgi:hypothetical protein